MTNQKLIQEALYGLQDHRTALIDAHKGIESSVDIVEIRHCLADEGVVSHTPVVTVPYEVTALRSATELNASYPWTEPHTVTRTREAYEKRQQIDAGASVREVSFPTPFWATLLDVVILVDDTKTNTKEFGKLFGLGNTIDMAAHELTHGAFAKLTKINASEADGEVTLNQKYCIGQVEDIKTLRPFSGKELDYEPVWLDEAFAGYMAAVVRSRLIPEASPTEPRVMNDKMYDIEVEVPAKYLLKIEGSNLSYAMATYEGAGFDILIAKRPTLLIQIKALAAGKLAVTSFHDYLLNSVGTELYGDFVERRPYDSWGDTFEQITQL